MLKSSRSFRSYFQYAVQTAAIVFLAGSTPAYAAAVQTATPVSAAQPAALTPTTSSILTSADKTQTIRIMEASGLIERLRAGTSEWKPVKAGDLLESLDSIRTGHDGAARIEFDGKIRLQILPDTELTIDEALRKNEKTRQTLLSLSIGKIKADVDKLGSGSSFKIKTPTAIAAVRGTVLYLNVVRFAQGLAGIATDLYVDKGKVDFAALKDALNGIMVEKLNASTIGGDGGVAPQHELSAEDREALIGAFEEVFKSAGNPQMGVETGALPGGGGSNLTGPGDDGLRDALEDLIDQLLDSRNENTGIEDDGEEINPLADLKEKARRLANGVDGSGNFEYRNVNPNAADFDSGIVTDERGTAEDAESLLGGIVASDNPIDVVLDTARLQVLRDREKQDLRNSLASILDNQEFLGQIAANDKRVDAQTGKVFTDVHGNRVRTDQYIYHEDGSDLVRFVSMTLRAGDYQRGVSSFEFGVRFNEGLSEGTILRDLPWNDYLNVVTYEELETRYVSGTVDEGDGDGDDDRQFIVHEHSVSGQPLPIYPIEFYAEFRNPADDRIRFFETYTDPVIGTFRLQDGEDSPTADYWLQERNADWTEITPFGGDTIAYGSNPDMTFDVYTDNDNDNADGSQTNGFAADTEGIAGLDSEDGINFYRNLEQNENGVPGDDLHPAYFHEKLTNDGELIGLFLPIDNLGKVIDAPGFTLEGIRDLIHPNSQVAGGKYNLEVILAYGHREDDGESEDYFVEDFRIDVIITPEIFEPYGLGSGVSLFPDRLIADDDDRCRSNCIS